MKPPRLPFLRGGLPHVDAPDHVQFVTIRVSDSLPAATADRLRCEALLMPPALRNEFLRGRVHRILDSGHGSLPLRDPRFASIVEDALRFGDGSRYRLLAWVIMPNHVHFVMEQTSSLPLARIVQSLKRHTAASIHRCAVHESTPFAPHPFWQRGYFDRVVRDERQLLATIRYIENNPVHAGLATCAADWPWGSARFGEERISRILGDYDIDIEGE